MAFVALRQLKVTGQDGERIIILPGQLVPNFAHAQPSVKMSLLRGNYVRDTEDGKRHPQVVDGRIAMMKHVDPVEHEAPAEAVSAPGAFACTMCDRSFKTRGRLNNHAKAKH